MGYFYKPLTPELRRRAIKSIDANIAELNTCKRNALVNAQITAWEATRTLIKRLPDGYPMPMTKGGGRENEME